MTGFKEDASIKSWGGTVRALHRVARPAFRDELAGLVETAAGEPNGLLGIGLRRSYGDSGLNAGGSLIDASRLDRLIAFDPATGILHAEAGLSLRQLLQFSIPRGFFLPVTPGTTFVTLGGAVANDVHGKNHRRNGTIGRWIQQIGLLRSDGTHSRLTPEDNSGLFAATIGGLGLTGMITDVALELVPIRSSDVDAETIAFCNIEEFFDLTDASLVDFEHMVAWVDFHASAGRGIFTRANHAQNGRLAVHTKSAPTVPFDFPEFVLNSVSMRAFNAVYFRKQRMGAGKRTVNYDTFFYPLDSLADWSRVYGHRGMIQYQCVLPRNAARQASSELLRQISLSGQASFLAVLKTFGALPSPGMLSFPMEGTTLALDFPNRGETTLALLDRLDRVVKEARGRLYAAKDVRIPKDLYLNSFPRMDQFVPHIDPAFSSSFWRRVRP